jgi:hypothetical protein
MFRFETDEQMAAASKLDINEQMVSDNPFKSNSFSKFFQKFTGAKPTNKNLGTENN